jgi:hypothetical protein
VFPPERKHDCQYVACVQSDVNKPIEDSPGDFPRVSLHKLRRFALAVEEGEDLEFWDTALGQNSKNLCCL